jgi:hypothetical protein
MNMASKKDFIKLQFSVVLFVLWYCCCNIRLIANCTNRRRHDVLRGLSIVGSRHYTALPFTNRTRTFPRIKIQKFWPKILKSYMPYSCHLVTESCTCLYARIICLQKTTSKSGFGLSLVHSAHDVITLIILISLSKRPVVTLCQATMAAQSAKVCI